MMDELIYASATSLVHAIRAQEVSSTEVVEAYLQRIDTVNPRLNAIVQMNAEAARAQAHAADAALARGHPQDHCTGCRLPSKMSLIPLASFPPSAWRNV